MITISAVLDPETLRSVINQAEQLIWGDGAATAGNDAGRVKRNQQADLSSRAGAKLRTTLEQAVTQHPVLRAAAWPRIFSRFMLSRTREGGGYGLHVDNALMGSGERRLRTDLSFTLFLSSPASYDGGELMIEGVGGTQVVKPDAGDLVVYPSSSVHQVATVTKGVRLVCVGWIESMVRDGAQREILFDLETLKAELAKQLPPEAPEMLVLSKTIANLLRQWAVA